MLGPFFRLAMLSISRQAAFRRAVVVHLLALGAVAAATYGRGAQGQEFLAQFVLVAGIVEGALLIGWRLTQLPKSQALEFLLVSPLRPRPLFIAEALVGASRLTLVQLTGLPLLLLLALLGRIEFVDLGPLLIMPLTWGLITGIGLTVWAYELLAVRRWGERFLMAGIVVYLIVGVLAGEHLASWLHWISQSARPTEGTDELPWFAPALDYGTWLVWRGYMALHLYNPFGVMRYWFLTDAHVALERMVGLQVAAMAALGVLVARAGSRLKGHFHDRHYRPITDPTDANRGHIGNRPLSWWAVKRVTEYSGRVNLWLAGGFGLLYAAYTVFQSHWPVWLGRVVFDIVEMTGGIPVLATGLVVLAAVPAAFQYGLWDSNAQDRCRRLELLLLTDLDATDYWSAAAAAAWRRGRGYFYVALLLWAAALAAGRMSLLQVVAAATAGAVLWGLYFALGFRAFSRGAQANGFGSLLTLGLPLVVFGLTKSGWPALAALMPPGSVYYAGVGPPTVQWALGPLLSGALALWLSRHALAHCDVELRRWYELHHGAQGVE